MACERKWDKGLDAQANGGLEPRGNGIGLACSLTATLDKIASDAAEVKKNYPDVRILIFGTAGKVTNHTAGQWAEEIRKNFGLELIVVSREELVTSLLDRANADICRAQLGIPVAMAPELEPAVQRSLAAAAEVADDWQRHVLRAGRPLIERKGLAEHGLVLACAHGKRVPENLSDVNATC